MPLQQPVIWRLRAELKGAIRGFFNQHDYLEIDTPIAVVCPGTETYLRYFPTTWQNIKGEYRNYFLRSSPELHMKQALAMGASRIFQLAPCFRNHGELARWHHPEFTMLEWYEAHLGFEDFMSQTENLLHFTRDSIAEQAEKLGFIPIKLPPRFLRLTVAEAFKEFARIELVDGDPDLARKGRLQNILSLGDHDDFETAYFKILLEKIEPNLKALGAVILYDYPPSQAALATIRHQVAKRCEVYISGVELANGFEELTDPETNRTRILDSHQKRHDLRLEVPREDQDFYSALRKGLPPCSGNALGFDRWLALILGLDSLEEVIPFRRAEPYGVAPEFEN